MNCAQRLIVICASLAALQSIGRAEVTAERSDRGVVVQIDGELFTEYLTKAGQAPAMWPVMGPTGEPMTRAYPVGPSRKGVKETDDHPHHQSVWFTHDQVNGANFWEGNRNDRKDEQGPHIEHREFVEVKNEGKSARVITRNDWMDGDKRICEDQRIVVFGTRPNKDRWIDFTITIKATDGDVTFGDTKEGTFGVRVADSMRVDAKLGGRIVNSEGQTDEAAWGLPAKWVDYTGPVEKVSGVRGQVSGKDSDSASSDTRHPTPDTSSTVGIAIFSHPKSFHPTPRWHVRTYGLFTANPFGQRDFPNPEAAKQGAVTIKKGDSLKLRYRILLHSGATNRQALDGAFDEFARD